MEEEAIIEAGLEEQRLRLAELKADRSKAISKKRYEVEVAKLEEEAELLSIEDELEPLNHPVSQHCTPSEKAEINKWLDTVPIGEGRPPTPIEEVPVKSDESSPINPPQQPAKTDGGNDITKFIARQSIAKDLPIFTGEPKDWPMFISQFRGTTAACGFSDFENMTRLERALRGKAKEAVQSMLLIPSNVEKVLKTLEMSFGRPRVIVEMLVQSARQVKNPVVSKPESLIDFSNAVENLVTTMEMLSETGHMRNPTLMRELTEKLPDTFKMNWGRVILKKPEDEDLKGFANWLSEEAQVMSLLHLPSAKDVVPEKKRESEKKKPHEKRVVFFVDEKEQKQKSSEASNCLFCSKRNHNIVDCRQFAKESVESKWTFVADKNLCFSCLKSGHRVYKCQWKTECQVEECKALHHPLLHRRVSNTEGAAPEVVQVNSVMVKYHSQVKVVRVKLKGPKGELDGYAIEDEGAETTLMDSAAAKQIGLRGTNSPLKLNWIVDVDNKVWESEKVSLFISGEDGKNYRMNNVRTVNNFDIPTQNVNMNELCEKYKYLRKVKLPSLRNAKPVILIGQDNAHLIITREKVEGPPNCPILSKCKLGWALHGPTGTTKENSAEFCYFMSRADSKLDELDRLMKESFSIEGFGVQPLKNLPKSKSDIRAEKIIDETTVRVDGRWQTGLLWKNDEVTLPPSKAHAMMRLKTVEKKMDRDPVFGEAYNNKMKHYVEKGYARVLTKEEAAIETLRKWYLAHFGVTNVNKPGKLRLVFDCRAKVFGVSLNDVLMAGPDKLMSLLGVTLRFRREKIAFTADIVEMFHQVKIKEEDRQSQRFLWRGFDRDREPDVLEMTVMTFGATCSPCLAQEVKNRNALEFEKDFPEAVRAIIYQMFVDDYLGGAADEEKSIKLIKDIIHVNQQGGFELRSWTCNNREVLEAIPQEYRSNKIKSLESKEELPTERVLGLFWDPNSDCFQFTCNFPKIKKELIDGSKIPTKRQVLQVVMSVYDPLGFLANFIVRGKILMQDIWRSGVGWDDEIESEANEKWSLWLEILKTIPTEVKIPRWFFSESATVNPVQLHIFVDASEQAYSAVAYFRSGAEGSITTSLVMAKTRVTPLKPISIPRAELQAAVMGSRLSATLKQEAGVEIDRVIFWSDSRTVIQWLHSDARKYQAFVAHRIGEIMENTNIDDWRWIPTEENVADEGTRDIGDCRFGSSSRWINGPDFLKETEEHWPKEKVKIVGEGSEPEDSCFSVQVINSGPVQIKYEDRFSSWTRMIRVTAYVMRFWQNSLKSKGVRKHGLLKLEELDAAQVVILKRSQVESFPEEIKDLSNRKPVSRGSRLLTLSPYLDEKGIIRMRGRTQNADELQLEQKRPMILDSKNHSVQLLIQHYHERMKHQGQETVINELRQLYWILNIRAAVKRAWAKCKVCIIARANPKIPEMGQLPAERVTRQSRPFVITGVDYFGPINVIVKRSTEKRYGVVFTCLTTRAIHLEIAGSLNTDSAIMAIRRFIARRGYPAKLFSDNGTNFHGADNEMKKAIEEIKHDQIGEILANKGIEWHFIPPSAPHFGGCWERMVRAVKTALGATLKQRNLKEEVLMTLLAEAEFTINCHPLTHVSVDPKDEEALTPNHFLLGNSGGIAPLGQFDDRDLCLRKQWRLCQRLADHFWARWMKEYLPTLTRRTKWHQPAEPIRTGDLVLIADGDLPRNLWPRGRIANTFPGKDGIVRAVDVKTQFGMLRRPVAKICKLDVEESPGPEGVEIESSTGGSMSAREIKITNVGREQKVREKEKPNETVSRVEDGSVNRQVQAKRNNRSRRLK